MTTATHPRHAAASRWLPATVQPAPATAARRVRVRTPQRGARRSWWHHRLALGVGLVLGLAAALAALLHALVLERRDPVDALVAYAVGAGVGLGTGAVVVAALGGLHAAVARWSRVHEVDAPPVWVQHRRQ